jgi:hypothetical protein
MTDAEKAYAEAERLIAKERKERSGWLIISHKRFDNLTTLPPEISDLNWLKSLDLEDTQVEDISSLMTCTTLMRLNVRNTQVTDISPLTALNMLTELFLDNTPIADLRPCRHRTKATTGETRFRLYFSNSLATQLDPELANLSLIEDTQYRTRQTLDYLNSLDDAEYDAFLARRKRELGIVEREAVATPPKPSPTAKARAEYLAPRIAAHREVILPLADQIQNALREWQNETGTNQLPEALQLIEHLASGFALAVQQSDIQDLEARLAYLETEGQKLATLLKQEQAKTAALSHELSEAKAAKFSPSFREQMGKRSADLVAGGVLAFTSLGVTYLLGEAHPVTKALISLISPK